MLFTMISDLVARSFVGGVGIRERSEMKTVVLPEPVGRETPIRVEPDAIAVVQASKHCS